MGRLRRKRNHCAPGQKKGYKTRRYGRDFDQVYTDMKPENEGKLKEFDEDKPGSGQYYCFVCRRYFINKAAMEVHNKTKEHKRSVKRIQKEEPYTQQEADAAGGLGIPDNGK